MGTCFWARLNLNFLFSELENRMLMAALPFALEEKKTSACSPGDLFWKIINVSNFNLHILTYCI